MALPEEPTVIGGRVKLSKLMKVYFRVEKITLAGYPEQWVFGGLLPRIKGKFSICRP